MKQISLVIALISTSLFTSCTKDCSKAETCHLEPNVGPCNAAIPSYYFDKTQNKCLEFIWGGCEGVRPFVTIVECEQACECNK